MALHRLIMALPHHRTTILPSASPRRAPVEPLCMSLRHTMAADVVFQPRRPKGLAFGHHAHPCVRTHVHRPRVRLAELLELGNTDALHKHRVHSPWPEHGHGGAVPPALSNRGITSAPTSFASPRDMSRARWEEKRSPRAAGRLATPMRPRTRFAAVLWPSRPTPTTMRG